MKIISQLSLIVITVLLTFSCSQESVNYTPKKTTEESSSGNRFMADSSKINKLIEFSDKYFSSDKGYLVKVNENAANGFYILMKGEGNQVYTPDHVSTSEAMGYGMRLAAMRINISTSQEDKERYIGYVDGLWNVQKAFKSQTNSNLHSWVIPSTFSINSINGVNNPNHSVSSATDGEMDIALALLLMDKLNLSNPKHNYKEDAKKIILALGSTIQSQTVNGKKYTYLPTGDWAIKEKKDGSLNYSKYLMRSSDFLTHHIKTFIRFMEAEGLTSDPTYRKWKDLLSTIKYLYTNNPFSSKGLFPDFIYINGSTNSLEALDRTKGGVHSKLVEELGEDVTENKFSYNACRLPWRMAEDVYFSSDITIAKAAHKIYNTLDSNKNNYTIDMTGVEYNMAGVATNTTYTSQFYEAPVAATINSAMLSSMEPYKNQSAYSYFGYYFYKRANGAFDQINSGFQSNKPSWATKPNHSGYYHDSINLFCQYLLLRNKATEPYSTIGLK